MSVESTFDTIIIGAGAAGMMCGATAGQRGRKVLLLERSPNIGQKISISGGGRCNFTNLRVDPKNYFSDNPHFCKSALSRFTPLDFIKLIEKHGIAYHEKTAGQLFCNDRAQRIVDLLVSECKAGGVIIKTGCAVKRIEKKDLFSVQTDTATYTAPALVVATGGLSYPQTGATGFGYEIAAQFGLGIIACAPALVPLSYQPADVKRYGSLSGISIFAAAATGSTTFTDAILFTHKGLSGPAILQLSSYWSPGEPITLDLLPHLRLNEAIPKWKSERPTAELKTLLREHLPERLAQRFLDLHGRNRPVRQLTERDEAALARIFHHWQIQPRGTEGYGKAEVTRGGVDTRELSSKTFESRNVPGLYFIGEVLDVTGWLGGFNFQWAWASGHCAGLVV
ncbi:MAG TPA: NAD(P)/FAD-dependent oxidoreductase [Desulfobacterales bacterium]|nr:NAD(P)/FAD-dependent oxidoreductase [Desulfobacterales bacterium]